MNARARLRYRRPDRKPRIVATLTKGGAGYWIDRWADKGLEVEYAGTFDEAVSVVDGWIQEAS